MRVLSPVWCLGEGSQSSKKEAKRRQGRGFTGAMITNMVSAAPARGAQASGWWPASAQLSNYLTSNSFYPGPSEALGWAGLGWAGLGVTNISIVCPLHSSARRNISNQQPASRVIQKFLSQLIFIFHDNK